MFLSVDMKKSKVGKSSRNVLAPPKFYFWPLLQDSDEASKFITKLQKSLKQARTIQPQLKWSEVRKMCKEERKCRVNEFYEKLSPEEIKFHEKAKQLRNYLVIGVNEVSRSLEKKKLACCLVHGEAKPKMLISNLVELAKHSLTPIIILNDLKSNMAESIGFPSLAVGFTKETLEQNDHEFYEVSSMAITLAKKFGTYLEPIEANNQTQEEEMEAVTTESKQDNDTIEVDYKSIYLYRESSNYRVFHPTAPDAANDISQGEQVLDSINGSSEIPCKKKKFFVEPNILRVQSNPNKVRKKKKKK